MIARLIIGTIILLIIAVLALVFWPNQDHKDALARLNVLRTEPALAFQEPQLGDRVRIELSTGKMREGIIHELTEHDVTLSTPSGEVTYPRQVIAEGSRQLLFRADFEGTPPDDRPATIVDEELIRLLQTDDPVAARFGLGPRVQYVIAGTNAIFLYGFPE